MSLRHPVGVMRPQTTASANVLDLDMGWLWLVGSLTLQVSFAEYSLFYRALLQKRPIILRMRNIAHPPFKKYRVAKTHRIP